MTRHPDLHTAGMMAETGRMNNVTINRVIIIFARQVGENSSRQTLLKILFQNADQHRDGGGTEQERVFIDFFDDHIVTAS